MIRQTAPCDVSEIPSREWPRVRRSLSSAAQRLEGKSLLRRAFMDAAQELHDLTDQHLPLLMLRRKGKAAIRRQPKFALWFFNQLEQLLHLHRRLRMEQQEDLAVRHADLLHEKFFEHSPEIHHHE